MVQAETVPVDAAAEATADTDPAALIDLDSASSRSSEAVAGEDTGRELPQERTHTMQTEAGGSLEVAPAGKPEVALGRLPAAGQCSNSRRLGLGCDPGEKAGRGKGQRVDEGAACCIRPSFVDYTPLKVSLPASYRSNGRRWRALRANPKVYRACSSSLHTCEPIWGATLQCCHTAPGSVVLGVSCQVAGSEGDPQV